MKLTYKKRLKVVIIWQKHYKFDDLANCMLLLAKIKSLGDPTSGSAKLKSLADPTSEYIQFYSFLQVNLNFGRFFQKTSKNA